jgi:hypothetical protein
VRETMRGVVRTGVWDAAVGGTGERIELCKTRRASVTAHAGHAGLRSTCRAPSELSEPSRLIYSHAMWFHLVFGPFPLPRSHNLIDDDDNETRVCELRSLHKTINTPRDTANPWGPLP